MAIRSVYLVIAAMGVLTALASADSEALNRKHVQFSANNQYYIEMIPEGGSGGAGPGQGFARRRGSQVVLWKVNWFSSQVVLSDDGIHLIRFGPWASDRKRFSDLAVAFYANGKELKQYSVNQLVKEPIYLQWTISHYFWQAYEPSVQQDLSKDGKSSTLALLDGSVYVFDVASGKILSQSTNQRIRSKRFSK